MRILNDLHVLQTEKVYSELMVYYITMYYIIRESNELIV